ncbi:hypothetical protein FA95DRAFT_1585366 [Auriscalpium vulgare]|uniref:Uncharacterized protein n=1 Tax=Auriscalpium vulgare TaxID=40419 RepID=A0ACB8R4M0_9AGAM|nr:hypothetical protein FA95DRAFT_1585366 [Auriscalpium vulgare]
MGDPTNEYHPFPSKLAWEVAKWAKLRGPTSTALTDLLAIEGVYERLELPFKTAKDLNAIIDGQLPPRPPFKQEKISVGGQSFDFYHRDALECIKALYGDPDFAPHMAYAPERHYTDEGQTVRVYNEMKTGKWWGRVQVPRKAGATVVPLLISTDSTQLTLFRNKSAYPIYMTIGNIPKDIRRKPSRRAQILLGYLPTSRFTHIKDKETRRRALANVFHACMRKILRALSSAGLDGVNMASGDGVVRRCHPILAAYIGDYPEQCRVVGCKNTECPKGCIMEAGSLGEFGEFERRDMDDVFNALATAADGPEAYLKACAEVGIKPLHRPFWEDLPFTDIYESITPDVLHQLYQGLVKRVIGWLKKVVGPDEIDARFARLPPNHHLRLFSSGVSHLSRVSGQEHKDICRVLLGTIIGIQLPGGVLASRVIRAVRALLDFVYIAQYPSHSTDTLRYLDDALARFHADKDVFQLLGACHGFNLPKLHSMLHYVEAIKLFGTTDNYNTEYTERLHIDLAKDAYRATNHKDEYPQMTTWLLRREKVMRHDMFIKWRLAGSPPIQDVVAPQQIRHLRMKIARSPNTKAVSFLDASRLYGADDFKMRLAEYLLQWNNPEWTTARVRRIAAGYTFAFKSVAAFNKVKFWHPDAQGQDNAPETLDCVYARPAYRDTLRRVQPARFDTALVADRDVQEEGSPARALVQGFRVVQVRMIFTLSRTAAIAAFPNATPARSPPQHLAYVEWFSRFQNVPEANNIMYRVQRAHDGHKRMSSIIPAAEILRSVHLIPKFGAVAPRDWSSSNVLDRCSRFLVNSFSDRNTYISIY